MSNRVRVFAPASVSNLGPGFDVVGLALSQPGDLIEAELRQDPGVEIVEVTGDQGALPATAEDNVAGIAAAAVLRARALPDSQRSVHHREGPGVRLWVHKRMPLFSGLGSSAASSVGGAVAVNELLGRPFERRQLLPMALEGERAAAGAPHADNVAPSLLGGIVLIRSYHPLDVIHLPVPAGLWVVVAHPHCEVSTAAARALLRDHDFRLPEIVSNLGNLGALVSAIYQNDLDLLGRSINDLLVEPLRAHLIPGFQRVKEAAVSAGALGCSISGSGPSVFALSDRDATAEQIGEAMRGAFRDAAGLECDVWTGTVNPDGATIQS
jgi:homoserine kinase